MPSRCFQIEPFLFRNDWALKKNQMGGETTTTTMTMRRRTGLLPGLVPTLNARSSPAESLEGLAQTGPQYTAPVSCHFIVVAPHHCLCVGAWTKALHRCCAVGGPCSSILCGSIAVKVWRGVGWVGPQHGSGIWVCRRGGGTINSGETRMGQQGQVRLLGAPIISRPVAFGPQQIRGPAPRPSPWWAERGGLHVVSWH